MRLIRFMASTGVITFACVSTDSSRLGSFLRSRHHRRRFLRRVARLRFFLGIQDEKGPQPREDDADIELPVRRAFESKAEISFGGMPHEADQGVNDGCQGKNERADENSGTFEFK